MSEGGATNDLLILNRSGDEKKKKELEARGVRVEQLAADGDGRVDINAVLRRLGELEITSVMIEGGATLNGTALASGVVDKLFLYYAPTILGSAESVPFASSAGLGLPYGARPVHRLKLHRFEEDFAVEGYLRDLYEQ